jgi:hypothetical protein
MTRASTTGPNRGEASRLSVTARDERPGCSGTGEDRRSRVTAQWLRLTLEGITAGDYLGWVRDPEPLALERDLRRVTARADPLGDRIEIELIWDREPPAPRLAVLAAGFPLIPEVIEVAEVAIGAKDPASPATETHNPIITKERAVSPHIYRLLMSQRRAEQPRRTERHHLQQSGWMMGVRCG